MFAVAIPTLNERQNIRELTLVIDRAAQDLNISILIINSDNNSSDDTVKIFNNTTTENRKISLHADKKGKGHNIKNIFDFVTRNTDVEHCLLIDGDVTSFEKTWLSLHYQQYKKNADYVVPNYARKMIEGNTTNHFAYPLLNYYGQKHAPQQPIAGDFGVSRKFICFINSLQWPVSALQYGIDIFLTINALTEEFHIVEIDLNRKIHKPSLNKMMGMFTEVATTYYATMQNHKPRKFNANIKLAKSGLKLVNSNLDVSVINKISKQAGDLFNENIKNEVNLSNNIPGTHIGAWQWADILAEHEEFIGKIDAQHIAQSLLPFFMIRVSSYLGDNFTPEQASRDILLQATLISKALQRRGL